jgi:Sec-independent protein translocase protein TatA
MTDVGLVLVVILILAVIWRGPKTLPKIGQALGRGVKEARREAADIRGDVPPPDAERDDTPVPPV